MRIIAGTARGRKLTAPGRRFGSLVRPTADRAREALFSILAAAIPGARVLDLFAGTGALGLEALSRGAESAVFVEGNRAVAGLTAGNIVAAGFADRALLLEKDWAAALLFLSKQPTAAGFTVVFLDPPYGKDLGRQALEVLSISSLLAPDAVLIVEDRADQTYPEAFGTWHCRDQRRYGEAGFWFYRQEGNP